MAFLLTFGMDINKLLSNEVQKFISENRNTDTSSIMLKSGLPRDWPLMEIVQQIEGRRKSEKKLPELADKAGIIFPPKLNLEQASSEKTAKYKASLLSGTTIMDLTGGFGIDTIAYSRVFKKVTYVEQNKELTDIVKHNLSVLQIFNVDVKVGDLNQLLVEHAIPDVYYLDPARRVESKKIVSLKDCEPNVLELLPLLMKANQVLIKTSPMLDISKALEDLSPVSQVMVVSVENECKEVLYLLDKNSKGETEIHTVNLLKSHQESFTFTFSKEKHSIVELSEPLTYLYEPNSSILKAGAFKSLGAALDLAKLHNNSHLYTSAALVSGFPGRTFKIKDVIKYSRDAVKAILPKLTANVTARNFPDSVEVIRKKTGLKEGGDVYIFATILSNNKPVLIICEKLSDKK